MTNGNEIFNWPRYWYPNDQNDFFIFTQFGYLNLPTEELSPYYNFVPSRLSELESIHILILLGDAGTGKSQSLVDERNRLQADNKNEIIYCDLKVYGSGDQQELAEILNQKDFNKLEEDIKLWFLIDGLDECGLYDPSDWLIRKFINKITTPNRVYIRISCRVSSWPETLEEAFRRKWQSTGESPVKKLRLCPLREEDLRIAAQTMGLDADGFLQVVAQGDAQQLAALPVTANFMLNLYSKGQLPSQRTDIFEKGLNLICEDSPARRNTKRKGQISSDKRFIVAARLSLGYIMLGSNGIWNGPRDECPSNLFLSRDIYGKDEYAKISFDIDEVSVAETLEMTGIFTRLSPHRYQFISRTFAEFLAAWYLSKSSKSKVPTTQKLKLLLHPESQRLIPDIYETAGWLAALDKEFLRWLIAYEPFAALEADFATLAKGDLPALVNGLLDFAAREERHSYDPQCLSKLNHPGLHEQLVPIITNTTYSLASRALACRIVNACKLNSMGQQFADLILNDQEDLELRKLAVTILTHLDNDDAKVRLMPIARVQQNITLKGLVLALLGPRLMGAKAFFAEISANYLYSAPTELEYVIGEDKFVECIGHDGIIIGLQWIEAYGNFATDEFSASRLKSKLLLKAFEYLDQPNMVENLVKVLIALHKNYNSFFRDDNTNGQTNPLDDLGKRHIVLMELMKQIKPDEVTEWIYNGEDCARQEDLPWLLERLDMDISEQEHHVVAKLISNLIPFATNYEIINSVLDRSGLEANNPDLILASYMEWLINPYDLSSEAALKLKKWHYDRLFRNNKQRLKAEKLSKSDLISNVIEHLSVCEERDIKEWPKVILSLAVNNDGNYFFPYNLQNCFIWKNANIDLKFRVAKLALSYLEQTLPPNDEVLLGNSLTMNDLSGGFAVEVLANINKLERITSEIWGRWTLAILVHRFNSTELQNQILQRASSANPDSFVTAVIKILDQQAVNNHTSILYSIASVSYPKLEQLMFTRLGDLSWPFSCRLNLAEFLIDHGSDNIINYVCNWINIENDIANRRALARMLILKIPAQAWQEIAHILNGDAEFAKEVILMVARQLTGGAINDQLNAKQIGLLYNRLMVLFPPEDDPQRPNRVYSPTHRHYVSHFRDNMIGRLVSIGTKDATDELDRICAEYPNIKWLIRARADGYQQRWKQERTQISFPQAMELLSDQSTTIVRNNYELMVAVEEALRRFSHEAQHGLPPLAVFLWNEKDNSHFSEQRLSDFLKFYLEREWRGRKIILNREVEIRNLRDFGIGERTDLFIQATMPDDSAKNLINPSVVVEVKLDNNLKKDDINKQLIGKYLDTEDRTCGIYLVGWFGQSKESYIDLANRLKRAADTASTGNIKVSSIILNLSHPKNNLK
jgi:hypothetical protein